MKISVVSTDGDLTRILNEGDITQMDFRAGTDLLADLLGPECYTRKVLLNMEKTPYIDSAGVGWLIMANKRFKEDGGKFVIHSIAPMVYQILKLLHMPDILTLADDEESARAKARGEAQ